MDNFDEEGKLTSQIQMNFINNGFYYSYQADNYIIINSIKKRKNMLFLDDIYADINDPIISTYTDKEDNKVILVKVKSYKPIMVQSISLLKSKSS